MTETLSTAPPQVDPALAPEPTTHGPRDAARSLDRPLEPRGRGPVGDRGRPIARRNLSWSIFAEFLGFVVWQLWTSSP